MRNPAPHTLTQAQADALIPSLVAHAREVRRLAATPGTPEHAAAQAILQRRADRNGYLAAVARRYS